MSFHLIIVYNKVQYQEKEYLEMLRPSLCLRLTSYFVVEKRRPDVCVVISSDLHALWSPLDAFLTLWHTERTVFLFTNAESVSVYFSKQEALNASYLG